MVRKRGFLQTPQVNLVAAMVSDALGGGDVVVEGVDPWWF